MDLEAVYPDEVDPNKEMSFEELRAKSRGWLSRDWAAESKQRIATEPRASIAADVASEAEGAAGKETDLTRDIQSKLEIHDSPSIPLDATIAVDIGRGSKAGRPKKMKIKEVKGETQTSTC